jgi:DNA-binding transcriptional regulator YiaG
VIWRFNPFDPSFAPAVGPCLFHCDPCRFYDIADGEMAEEQLPEVVQRLVAWRKHNGLSQRAAVEVMNARHLPVTLTSLEKWEMGINRPGKLATHALLRFLEDHPTISQE